MDAASMKEILKNEYGIGSIDEFNEAVENSPGLNLGIFLSPMRRESDEEIRIVS
jgi:hypothetical protein